MTPAASNLWLLVIALGLDAIVGYPDAVYRTIRHPVVWIGGLIRQLDEQINRPAWRRWQRRIGGVVTLLVLLAVVFFITTVIHAVLQGIRYGWVAEAVLCASFIAQRSLQDHVSAVARSLEQDGLAGGCRAVAMIVGRDPDSLDEHGVSRAAIESLAENFSDGVVAPAFWLAIGGLPGIALYKAINTADSMIGHKSDKYRDFGWAAARLDDLVNLPASRISALLLVLASLLTPGSSPRGAFTALERDAGQHRSPNAGWPEAAMAGALGLRLAGPRRYAGGWVDDHWMGSGNAEATAADIRKALSLYRAACMVLGSIAVLAAIVLTR